jgi:hypothetical protein
MHERLKNKINSFIDSNDNRPLIIDVSNVEERDNLLQDFFATPKKSIFELVKSECELPEISSLYEYMSNCKEKTVILTDLGTYFKLLGQDSLQQNIHALLEKSFATKFIILTLQCGQYLNEKNPKNASKIVVSENQNYSSTPAIVFVNNEYKQYVRAENGLNVALRNVESNTGVKIYVLTSYKKKDFKSPLFNIEECKDAFELLCLRDLKVKKLKSQYGTKAEWSTLLNKLQNDSVEETIKEFIITKNFIKNIEEWNNKTPFEKWLLFIYSKLNNIKTENWAVNYAIAKANKYDEFLRLIYDSLLEINYKEEDFWSKYEQRKQILKKIGDDSIIYDYCNFIGYKKEDAIYYLTDNTDREKNLIIKIIDSYYQSFSKNKLLSVLKCVYPDLYAYLCNYNMGDELLNSYFNEYKYLKIINHLTPEFKAIVDKEACERNYKRILMYRSEKLDEISFDDAIVYFIDALGVEFLSYIERKCVEKGLSVNVHVAKANLPTLTYKNTEFREFFSKKKVEVKDEKELDSLIHDGKNDFDFDKNKLPIHIIEEFKIIDNCISSINAKLKSHSYEKAVIVSDHGATRLAILNTEMIKIDVESPGEHGGRVCKVIPNMEIIPNAIYENDVCILGDYNAFKGGRVGKVEMHGGATLEEVVVPIIEISRKEANVEIKVITEVIKVSYKTIAVLKFYSSSKLSNVTVHVNGASYSAESTDGFNFLSELIDLKRSGNYSFEVWANNKLVSTNNNFKIEKESAKTNNLWE